VFAAETETLGGLPSTIPGGDSSSMRHDIAMVAGVPAEALHLRAASFAAAESFPGHADEALSFGDDGFLMRGGIQNGLFELTVCAFRRPDTEVRVLAQSPLDSGEAFAVPVTLGSQAAVVAFLYTEVDADEFDTIGIQLQQDLWADLSQNREFPAFALAWSEAPAGCTSD
jgi:hypothetical protein